VSASRPDDPTGDGADDPTGDGPDDPTDDPPATETRPQRPAGDDDVDAERIPRVVPVDTTAGDNLLWWSWGGTALFTVTAFGGVAVDAVVAVSTPVAIVLFLAGVVLFARAFLYAVNERRTELIGVGGLFLLLGSAPRRVQWHLLGSLAVEIVVAFVTASLRPYTALAFGALVPMYALGLCGLWAARYGTFPPRPPEPERRRTR
jgi:hypothetical protein